MVYSQYRGSFEYDGADCSKVYRCKECFIFKTGPDLASLEPPMDS